MSANNIYSISTAGLGNISNDSIITDSGDLISEFHILINNLHDQLSQYSGYNQGYLRRKCLQDYIKNNQTYNDTNIIFSSTMKIFTLLIESYRDTDTFLHNMQSWPTLFQLSLKHTENIRQNMEHQQKEETYRNRLEHLNIELNTKNNKITLLNEEINHLKQLNTDLKTEKNEEINHLKQLYTELNTEKNEMQQSHQQITDEIHKSLREKQNDIQNKKFQIQQIEKQLNQKNQEMFVNMEEKDQIIQTMENRITQLDLDKKEYENRTTQLDLEFKENTRIRDEEIEQMKQDMRREIHDLQSKITNKDTMLRKKQEELDTCIQNLSTNEKEVYDKLRKKSEEAEKIRTQLEQNKRDLKLQYDENLDVLRQVHDDHARNINQLKFQLQQEVEQNAIINQNLTSYRDELNQEREKHEFTTKKLQKCLEDLNNANTNNQMEVDLRCVQEEEMIFKLKECQQELENRKQEWKQKCEEYNNIITNLNIEHNKLTMENQTLVAEKNKLDELVLSLKDSMHQKHNQILQKAEQIKADLNKQRQENETLQKKIQEDRNNFENGIGKINDLFPDLKDKIQSLSSSSPFNVIFDIMYNFLVDYTTHARQKHRDLNEHITKWNNSINLLLGRFDLKFDVNNLTYELLRFYIMKEYRETVWSLTSSSRISSSSPPNKDYNETTKQIQEYYYDKFKLQMDRVAYCIRIIFSQMKEQNMTLKNMIDICLELYTSFIQISPTTAETTLEKLTKSKQKQLKDENPVSWEFSARLLESDDPYVIHSTSKLNIKIGSETEEQFFKIAYPNFKIEKNIITLLKNRLKDVNIKQKERERKRERESSLETKRGLDRRKRQPDVAIDIKKSKKGKKEDKQEGKEEKGTYRKISPIDTDVGKERMQMSSSLKSPSAAISAVAPLSSSVEVMTED